MGKAVHPTGYEGRFRSFLSESSSFDDKNCFSLKAVTQEQQLARERNLETAQGDMQRRYHISDEAHPLQAGLDAAAGIADQVTAFVFPKENYLLNFKLFCLLS